VRQRHFDVDAVAVHVTETIRELQEHQPQAVFELALLRSRPT
jgi:hypothetical protein